MDRRAGSTCPLSALLHCCSCCVRWVRILAVASPSPCLQPITARLRPQCLCSSFCSFGIPVPGFSPFSGFLLSPFLIDSISSSGGALATMSL